MIRNPRSAKVFGALAAVAFLVSACGGPAAEDEPAATATATTHTSTSTSPSPSATTSPTAPTSTAPPVATSALAAETTWAAAVVGEGAECGPRGAVAAFADGSTAYCARLQYTDGAAWSRDPNLAPNPSVEEAMRQAGPQIGDQCIGADIGRTAVDAYGNAILCDNYQWVLNVGQEPRHPWVEEQVKWTECLEEFTETECQEMLN
ncbi:hypothetical protein [Rhodococcus sp. IEGM 1408]|uniref:hypothetical protein n=1 Tax=Rhodococcus sp. IEGM 1408 TaxID=3082220 RepID=UPI002952F007|nr:hypothetical protein [Rhodococcus sp. IEGM 1408]MDV8001525.1 hypothetical protein [Rhodococcus sp. IEGM 1408]